MNTGKYQIIKIIKESGKEPVAYDWDCNDVYNMEDSWLIVYGKDCGVCEREPISFLGTRYMTEEHFNLQVIQVTQAIIPEKTGCIFFFDAESEMHLCKLKTGFIFSLGGWLIPIRMVPEFLDIYLDGAFGSAEWTPYYRSMKYFDDFEGTGKIHIFVPKQ